MQWTMNEKQLNLVNPGISRRILWVVPKWPLPMQDGARVATINLIKGLTALGREPGIVPGIIIDLLAIVDKDEVCNYNLLKEVSGVKRCFIIRRRAGAGAGWRPLTFKKVMWFLKTLLTRPWIPITLAPYAESAVAKAFLDILQNGPSFGEQWDTLVYDGLHSAAHSTTKGWNYGYKIPENSSKIAYRIIYRAHNVEADIWKRKASITRFPPYRVFLLLQARLMKKFELSLLQKATAIMTVSSADFDIFKMNFPELRGASVPIAYDFSVEPARGILAGDKFRLLFLGRLDWPPNRDGLKWFLEEVWPEAKRQRNALDLWIAGSGNSEWLKDFFKEPGINYLGRVPLVDDLYVNSALSLVPIFYGSGTRVKAIEASRYGRACLGTALGMEGLGLDAGKTFFHAETRQEWIKTLAELTLEEVEIVGKSAYMQLKKDFHLPVAARKFIQTLQTFL